MRFRVSVHAKESFSSAAGNVDAFLVCVPSPSSLGDCGRRLS